MKRRTLFQQIGSILAMLGLTETTWLTLSNRYYQALAQPNSRKLALLIGINQYPQFPVLSGCLNDVQMQRELLVYRFGFLPSDILTLTDQQASRESIEQACLEHLVKQAKSHDVVFFHFSGYGSLVQLGVLPDTLQKALVPFDAVNLPTTNFVNYLLEETLLVLLRAISTDRVTAVLDSSYYTSKTLHPQGLGIRSLPNLPRRQLAIAELEFLQQLKTLYPPVGNPVVLSATINQAICAKEFLFADIKAGLFTYALTQYLWETTPASTIRTLLSHTGSTMYQLGSQQQPGLLLGEPRNLQIKLMGDQLLLDTRASTGVITDIIDAGKTIQLSLAGLPPQVLQYYSTNSQFTTATGQQLILKSRTGLNGKAQIASPDSAFLPLLGELIQESIRVLPQNINLLIALDPSLERIERVDATSAFAAINAMANIIAPEQTADYIFGKLQQTPSRYGLFSLGGELIFNTDAEIGEAIRVAVQRLTPKFSTLLAAKLWRLTTNEGSTRLPVRATLEMIDSASGTVVMGRGIKDDATTKRYAGDRAIPAIPVGSRMQYRLENLSNVSVYFILVGLNNYQSAIAFYPWIVQRDINSAKKPFLQEIVIPAGETLIIPQNETTSGWLFPTRAFFCEHQLIFSTATFSKTMLALSSAKYSAADQQLIGTLSNPLQVATALLQDLHNASGVSPDIVSNIADSYVLNVNQWASLSFCFQIV